MTLVEEEAVPAKTADKQHMYTKIQLCVIQVKYTQGLTGHHDRPNVVRFLSPANQLFFMRRVPSYECYMADDVPSRKHFALPEIIGSLSHFYSLRKR